MNTRHARRAEGRRVASMMCSYVQPVRPGAVPRRRRSSTVVKTSAVMQRGGVSEAVTGGRSSCGCRAANCWITSGVASAMGRACRQRAARPTLPDCMKECMRAARLRSDGVSERGWFGVAPWVRGIPEAGSAGGGISDCADRSMPRMRRCLPLPGATVRQVEGRRRRVRMAFAFASGAVASWIRDNCLSTVRSHSSRRGSGARGGGRRVARRFWGGGPRLVEAGPVEVAAVGAVGWSGPGGVCSRRDEGAQVLRAVMPWTPCPRPRRRRCVRLGGGEGSCWCCAALETGLGAAAVFAGAEGSGGMLASPV
jgi:hypothetical protein